MAGDEIWRYQCQFSAALEHHCCAGKTRSEANRHVLIVVSALSGVTDLLSRLAGATDLSLAPARWKRLNSATDCCCGAELEDCLDFEQRWQDLLELSAAIQYPANPQFRAELLAHGELMSSALGKKILERLGLTPSLQDARRWLHADAQSVHTPLAVRCPDHADPEMQIRLAGMGPLHITQGFIVSGSGR